MERVPSGALPVPGRLLPAGLRAGDGKEGEGSGDLFPGEAGGDCVLKYVDRERSLFSGRSLAS